MQLDLSITCYSIKKNERRMNYVLVVRSLVGYRNIGNFA